MEQTATYKRHHGGRINIEVILGIVKDNWMQARPIYNLSEKFQQPKIATNSSRAQKLKPSGYDKSTTMKSWTRENIFAKQKRIDKNT